MDTIRFARNTALLSICAGLLGACAHFQPERVGQTAGKEYTVTVKNTLARLQLSRTLFVVSSKSGTTAEVTALYKFFRAQVDAGKPPKPGQSFAAITDPGSPLEKLAGEAGFRPT